MDTFTGPEPWRGSIAEPRYPLARAVWQEVIILFKFPLHARALGGVPIFAPVFVFYAEGPDDFAGSIKN